MANAKASTLLVMKKHTPARTHYKKKKERKRKRERNN